MPGVNLVNDVSNPLYLKQPTMEPSDHEEASVLYSPGREPKIVPHINANARKVGSLVLFIFFLRKTPLPVFICHRPIHLIPRFHNTGTGMVTAAASLGRR